MYYESLYLPAKEKVERDGFWTEYRDHKQRDTQLFKDYYNPAVKNYFKYKGILERKSLNYPIQGTSAEITKLAALKFFNWLVSTGQHKTVKICNIVHDEIVIECPEREADFMASSLQKFMEEAGKPFCKLVPLKATPVVTDFWDH
jgi:DNA polymerase I-like protein with 3'-5' exonuclease and polymerase domains